MRTLIAIILLIAAVSGTAQRATLNVLNPSANGTNFTVNLNNSDSVITITNNVNFLISTNRSATVVKNVQVVLWSGATNWNLAFNSSWKWLANTNNAVNPPATIASNTVAILTLKSYGISETNVIARFNVVQ